MGGSEREPQMTLIRADEMHAKIGDNLHPNSVVRERDCR